MLLALSACTTARPPLDPPPQIVSVAVTLAEPAGDAEAELERLRTFDTLAAKLRAAYLHLRQGRTEATIDLCAEVLHGVQRPTANEESFARYLRAEAFAARGQPELGRFDRDRARALALDPELLRRLPQPDVPRPASTPRLADLPVQSRSVWGAAAPNRRNLDTMTKVTRLTVHHSAVYFRDTRLQTCAAQLQKIQRDHMQGSGWADIGYHYLIDPAGRVWEGRELRWQGAHAEGRNNIGNIGICLLGNFMRGREGQQPTPNQVATLRHLVGQLAQQYSIGADGIFCHRDFKATECPGPLLQPIVLQLARDMARVGPARVAAGQP
jgi:hypothetical protein